MGKCYDCRGEIPDGAFFCESCRSVAQHRANAVIYWKYRGKLDKASDAGVRDLQDYTLDYNVWPGHSVPVRNSKAHGNRVVVAM